MLGNPGVSRADVTGAVLGTVRDSTQGIVAGAQVSIVNVQTNAKQETVSGADGSYRFLALAAGTYKLTVNAKGFRPSVVSDIDVKVNDQQHIDIALTVGTITEEVDVNANAVQVQTESTQLGDVIDSKKMLALPLNGRSYVDLLGLQAGVAPGTAQTIQQDRPVSGSLNPGNISVNGQRETANAFLVNGGDVSEGRNLGAGLVPNLDSIEEFRLITNSFDAEYGKFSGAVVNAITKSGTNGFHGDAFEFLRNDKMDATNYFVALQVGIAAQSVWLCGGRALLEEQTFLVLGLPRHAGRWQARKPAWLPYRRRTHAKATLILQHAPKTGTIDGPLSGPHDDCVPAGSTGLKCFQPFGLPRARQRPKLTAMPAAPARTGYQAPAYFQCGAEWRSRRRPGQHRPRAILAYIPAPTLPGDSQQLFEQQREKHRQRRQIRRARGFQQPEDRKLVVVLPFG